MKTYGELTQEDVDAIMQAIVFLGNTSAIVQQDGHVLIYETTALSANSDALTQIFMRHGVLARSA